MKIRGSSSLPMVLQAHVMNEILIDNGIDKDFSFRAPPFKSNSNIPIKPNVVITTALFMLTIAS